MHPTQTCPLHTTPAVKKKKIIKKLAADGISAQGRSSLHLSELFLLSCSSLSTSPLLRGGGADGADQRLVGNSADCHCAPTPPPSILPPTPHPSYLLAGQRGGLGADWQSLCSPSKTLQVDFIPMKNPLRDAFKKKMKPTGNKRRSAVKKKRASCHCCADDLLIAQKCLISVMSFPSPRRLPSVTSVALFTKGTRWWLDGLIHWDCFLANRMAAASAPRRRDNKPICTRMFLCLHSSYVSTLSVANTGHSCVQTEGHFTPHIGLFGCFWGGGGLNRCCVSALWPV